MRSVLFLKLSAGANLFRLFLAFALVTGIPHKTSLVFFLIMQALDKIRFLSLTDQSLLGEGDDAKLDIHVRFLEHPLVTLKI